MATSHSDRCPTCGRKHKRRNPQNALYWLLLHKMAERKWDGQTYSAESFHKYYAGKFLGMDDVKLPNGKVLHIPESTSKLDVAEFGDYFDKVQADANERGVWVDE
jgi:hypothetical protein